jgi:Glycosyl hydrolase family 26
MPFLPLVAPRRRAPRPGTALRRAALAGLVVAGSVAPHALGASAPSAATAQSSSSRSPFGGPVKPPRQGAFVGVYTESGSLLGQKQNSIEELEQKLHRKLDIDHYYTAWNSSFPDWREQWDADNGRIPFISWAKASAAAVNSGRYDNLIRARAAGIKALGTPVLLEWFWEMDGSRNRGYAKSPAAFIAAWRRIHDLFARTGAKNVAWVWCPNAWGFATGEAPKWYPGDGYVDWICADGYNWAPGRRGDEWRSFEWIFQPFYNWAAGKRKPLLVGEFGVQERKPGEKAQWLKDTRTVLKTKFPAIKGIVYFNTKRTYNWRLASSPSAFAAFKALAQDPYFNP